MTTNFSRESPHRVLEIVLAAPVILKTCAGIRTRNVEPISQAQPFLFSTESGSERKPAARLTKITLLCIPAKTIPRASSWSTSCSGLLARRIVYERQNEGGEGI